MNLKPLLIVCLGIFHYSVAESELVRWKKLLPEVETEITKEARRLMELRFQRSGLSGSDATAIDREIKAAENKIEDLRYVEVALGGRIAALLRTSSVSESRTTVTQPLPSTDVAAEPTAVPAPTQAFVITRRSRASDYAMPCCAVL